VISTFYCGGVGKDPHTILALSHLFYPFDTLRAVERNGVLSRTRMTVCEFDCRVYPTGIAHKKTLGQSIVVPITLINTVLIDLDQHPALATQYLNYYTERAVSYLSLIIGC
jgi:hypothetical protein